MIASQSQEIPSAADAGGDGLRCLHVMRHPRGVRGIAFAPGHRAGRLVTAGGADGSTRVWDMKSGKQKLEIKSAPGRSVECAAYNADGRLLAIARSDLLVQVFSTNGNIQPFLTLEGHTGRVLCVAFGFSGNILASGGEDGTVILWCTLTGEMVSCLQEHSNYVNTISFSRDGRWMVSGGDDGAVISWDLREQGQPELVETLHTDSGSVMEVVFSPDSRLVAVACESGTACLWDVSSSWLQLRCHHAGSCVQAIAFSPCGTYLATAGDDFLGRIWDADSGILVATIAGHTHRISGISFSSCGSLIATSSVDRTARIWAFDAQRCAAAIAAFASHTCNEAAGRSKGCNDPTSTTQNNFSRRPPLASPGKAKIQARGLQGSTYTEIEGR